MQRSVLFRTSLIMGLLGLVIALLMVSGPYVSLLPKRPDLQFTTYPDLADPSILDSDFQATVALHQECFEDVKRANLLLYLQQVVYPRSDASAKKRLRDKVEAIIDSDRMEKLETMRRTKNVTLARQGAQVVGLYNCNLETEVTGGSMVIFNVCLAPSLRGQGLGRALVQHAIDRCRQPGLDLTLFVYRDNHPAIKLYQQLGFQLITPPHDPGNGFDFFNKDIMKYLPASAPP